MSDEQVSGTEIAPDGQVWVCGACGKTSRTRYGFDDDDKNVCDPGWDESCMLNSTLCHEASLVRTKGGRVTHAKAVENGASGV